MVCNLKPANFRGSKSQGMLLAADDGENLGLLVPVRMCWTAFVKTPIRKLTNRVH